LDGSWFINKENNPIELIRSLNRGKALPHPIEIHARDTNLENVLVMFAKDPIKRIPKFFSFSSIRNAEERENAAERISKSQYEDINNAKDILLKFREAGVNKENIEEIESGWIRWLELQKQGEISIIKWGNGDFPGKFKQLLGQQDNFLQGIRTLDVQELGKKVFDFGDRRSAVDAEISKLRTSSGNNEDIYRDLSILEGRYHRIYDGTVAWKENCDSFESSISNVVEMLSDDDWKKGVDFDFQLEAHLEFNDIPQTFLQDLGTMEDFSFADFCWKHSAQLSNWWFHGDEDALRAVLNNLIDKAWKTQSESTPDDSKPLDFFETFVDLLPYKFLSIPIKLFKLGKLALGFGKKISEKERIVQRIIDINNNTFVNYEVETGTKTG